MFKKIVGPFLLPVSVGLEVMLLGLFFIWFTRRERTGKVLVTIGTALFGLLSYSQVSSILLRPLEYQYPPVLNSANLDDVKWVVVLGGGHTSDPKVPVTSQIEEGTLARLVEGIRLHKMAPGSNLIFSGGAGFDPVPNGKIMADVALVLGVDESDIVLENESKDTKDEARIIREMVGSDKFVLVTSASHMPRSMALFRKQGMEPIPAPTGHWVKERQGGVSPGMFFPGSEGLRKAERAVYEYLGLIWAKVTGQSA
ncbi:MAG: envelope biogenesis factor ElyC [Pseudomonadota bacterium]